MKSLSAKGGRDTEVRPARLAVGAVLTGREADVAKALPVGSDVDVVVLDVDSSGRSIRLSREAILDAQETEAEYSERAEAAPPEGFGSLADKLRGALKSRQQ